MTSYKLGLRRKRRTELSETAAEVILGALEARIMKLEARLAEVRVQLHPPFWRWAFWRLLFSPRVRADLRQQERECREGIRVLENKRQEVLSASSAEVAWRLRIGRTVSAHPTESHREGTG